MVERSLLGESRDLGFHLSRVTGVIPNQPVFHLFIMPTVAEWGLAVNLVHISSDDNATISIY